MGSLFDFLAVPLGYVLNLIYKFIPNYLVALFIFTLLTRALMFPLTLKSQKAQVKRMKLAPRLERLQKKYAKDPKKLQEKQMALYEKHGVSMTGGCMPLLVQMVLLFGVISTIYNPLTHAMQIPTEVTAASVKAAEIKENDAYYQQIYLLDSVETKEEEIRTAINKLDKSVLQGKTADEYVGLLKEAKEEFTIFGVNVLPVPSDGESPNWLWMIGILSGLTALGSSLLSMHYTKLSQGNKKQPGQGCTNGMMIFFMPAFSLYITFTVPGMVGIYWIFSNLIAIGQTYLLNKIYDPVKIREEAEREYQELRRKKAEDKKRLAEARKKEQAELQKQIDEENAHGNKKSGKKSTKKELPAEKTEEPAEDIDQSTEDTDATDAE